MNNSVLLIKQKHVVPFHSQWEEDGQISRECWLKAGKLGLLGTATSEEYGGIFAMHVKFHGNNNEL